jgi:flavin reductase (DIM6/NTAB) family NADH-FMN oxidoreductase RutF
MKKVDLGSGPFLYPKPATLVGSDVRGRPNYCVAACVGIVNMEPPTLAVSLNKTHYTTMGIRDHGTFSINTPSADMMEITDYCGLVSGHKVDKSDMFDTFYGQTGTAPMIRECPLSLECRVVQTLEFPGEVAFVGEIVAAYVDEACLTDGKPDIKKLDPLLFSYGDNRYLRVGEPVGRAWSVGKRLIHKER